jgi:hypothetical protein
MSTRHFVEAFCASWDSCGTARTFDVKMQKIPAFLAQQINARVQQGSMGSRRTEIVSMSVLPHPDGYAFGVLVAFREISND